MFMPFLCFQINGQSIAAQRCAAFEKGMNLSNWLEAAWQPNWPTANGYSKADLAKIKEAGMKSIRLPICFARITDSIAPYTVDTNNLLFARIDSVIQWTDELQMNLIIDNHHEWSLDNEHWRTNRERFAHLWAVLANKYRYLDPAHYTFELLNEPPLFFALDSLNIMMKDAIDSIRQFTTAHTIIVSPNASSIGIAYTTNYKPLADTNLIYTWHCYDPVDFTHQGFSWTNPVFPTGTPFPIIPTSFYESILYEGMTRLNHWRDTFNVPVFLGEFGVGEYADAASRCNWIQYMGSQLDSTHIPWFYWDWRWDFTMFNSHEISADSIIPCFSHSLHLYGDTVLNSVNGELNQGIFEVNLYPNFIASGKSIHVSVQGVPSFICKIFDSLGRLIQQQNFTQSDVTIPLCLAKGIYFAQFTTRDRRVTKKFVVD